MKLLNKNTALIVVDFQKGFDNVEYWGNRNNSTWALKIYLHLHLILVQYSIQYLGLGY